MSKGYLKISLLGLLLVMCMSVAIAADVSEDTTSDIIVPSENTIDYAVTEETVAVEENQEVPYNENQLRHIPGDNYTFANETLDITGNNYDGQTLTLLDNVNVYSSNNMQLSNTAFVVNGSNVNITGLKIINSNSKPIVITVTGSNVNIKNNNISLYCSESVETRAITVLNTQDVEVSNNTLSVVAVPQAAGWIQQDDGTWVNTMKVSAIKVQNSHDVTIDSNVLSLTNSTTTGEYWSTADVITIKGSNDTIISNNDITANGSDYVYGVSAVDFNNNITVFNNTIQLTGTNYICGVQYSSTSNSKASYNKVNGTCSATSGACPSYEAFAYGIISVTGTWGASTSEAVNNTIENNDVTLDSTIAYAYELSNAEYNVIFNNTATVTGNVVMALGIYNSSYNNITNNTFTVTGNTMTLNDSIYEAVWPVTTGIKIVDDGYNNTQNNNIIGNTIRVTDSNSTALYDIIIENANNTIVTENFLTFDIVNLKFRILDNGSNSTLNPNYVLI